MGDARRLGLLLVASAALIALAYQAPSGVFFDFGPNDSRYVEGFREDFEADGSTLIHWTSQDGLVRLPLSFGRGPLTLTYRFKRHARAPADVRVFAQGVLVDRFTLSEQDFTVRTARLDASTLPRKAFEVRFLSQSSDPRPLGIALDWLSVARDGSLAAVLPTPRAWVFLLATVAAFYLLPRGIGFSDKTSLGLGLAAAIILSLWAGFQKLAPLHAALALGLRPYVLALAAVIFYRWRLGVAASAFSQTAARWAVLAAFVGTTARLFALFHPEFYHPDVRVHAKFVSLIWTEGFSGFFSQYIQNQHRFLLGLEPVGGHWIAFPYPPLFYVVVYPFSRLGLPVDDWIKLVPTTLLGIEALVVYAVACRLGASARAAAAASWLHATAALVSFRLTTAFFAAVFGHFLDVLVGVYLLYRFQRIERFGSGAVLALLVATACLAYTGSVMVLGFAIPIFAGFMLKEPARAGRVLLGSLLGALTAIGVFYLQYVPELQSVGTATAIRFTPAVALVRTVGRLVEILSPVYAPLFVLGLFLTRPTFHHPLARPLAASVGGTFVLLNFLNHGLGEVSLFRSTKDDLLLLPLIALVLGALIEKSLRLGRVLLALWIAWGAVSLVRDVEARFNRAGYLPVQWRGAPPHARWAQGCSGIPKIRLNRDTQSVAVRALASAPVRAR